MWGGFGRGGTEPQLGDELGDLEGCMGVDESNYYCRNRSSSSSFLPSAMTASSFTQRLARAVMIEREKMRNMTKKQHPVESSLTISNVGSAEWCGLPIDASGEELTNTQLAAAQWGARKKSLATRKDLERSESASVTSAAETVHSDREKEQEREPVSFIVHIVSSPDNISGLCLKYDMSVEELLGMNKPATRTSLLARKTIKIPIFEQEDVVEKHEKGGGGAGGGGSLDTTLVELNWECGMCDGEAGNSAARVEGGGAVVHADASSRGLGEEAGYEAGIGGRGEEEDEKGPPQPSRPSLVSSSCSPPPAPPPSLAPAPSRYHVSSPITAPAGAPTPSSLQMRLPSF